MKAEKLHSSYSDDVRLALLEQSIGTINDTMVRFEKRFDKIDTKLDKLNDKINAQLLWLLGIGSTVALSVIGLMAKGFHWI